MSENTKMNWKHKISCALGFWWHLCFHPILVVQCGSRCFLSRTAEPIDIHCLGAQHSSAHSPQVQSPYFWMSKTYESIFQTFLRHHILLCLLQCLALFSLFLCFRNTSRFHIKQLNPMSCLSSKSWIPIRLNPSFNLRILITISLQDEQRCGMLWFITMVASTWTPTF